MSCSCFVLDPTKLFPLPQVANSSVLQGEVLAVPSAFWEAWAGTALLQHAEHSDEEVLLCSLWSSELYWYPCLTTNGGSGYCHSNEAAFPVLYWMTPEETCLCLCPNRRFCSLCQVKCSSSTRRLAGIKEPKELFSIMSVVIRGDWSFSSLPLCHWGKMPLSARQPK